MSVLASNDFFKSNPINEFVGAGFEKYRPNRQWERNINNASLYCIDSGKLTFAIHGRCFTAAAGDIVFLNRNDTAVIKNEAENVGSLYYIAFNYDERVNLGLSEIYRSTSYNRLFKDILDAHRSMAPFSSLKILYTFTHLIHSLSIDSLYNRKEYMETHRIQIAAEYININYYKNIDIDTLCKLTGYSPAHMRRLFIKTYGTSPQEYILNRRIEAAKELLCDLPEKTVNEITDLLGISSNSYFCKLFKAKTGLSPTQFRQSKLKTDNNDI